MIVAVFDRIRKGKSIVEADPMLSHAGNFLWMLNGEKPSDTATRAFDIALILHADHEFERQHLCRARHRRDALRSTLRHHGCDQAPSKVRCMAVLTRPPCGCSSPSTRPARIRLNTCGRCSQPSRRISGFGHRVYHTEDPRATHLRRMSGELGRAAGNTKWFDMSQKIEAFVKAEKKLNANVDFYSASTYTTLGIDIDLFTPIFAISRIAGWAAHVIEQHDGQPADSAAGRLHRPGLSVAPTHLQKAVSFSRRSPSRPPTKWRAFRARHDVPGLRTHLHFAW